MRQLASIQNGHFSHKRSRNQDFSKFRTFTIPEFLFKEVKQTHDQAYGPNAARYVKQALLMVEVHINRILFSTCQISIMLTSFKTESIFSFFH